MQIITNQSQKELKKHGSDMFPLLISYEKLSRYESGFFLWHWHPEIEITYVRSGQIAYKVNHQCHHLQKGEILFTNANALHTGSMENMQDCEYVSITFSPKLIYGFPQSTVCTKYVEPVIRDFSLSAIHFDFSQQWHMRFAALVMDIIQAEQDKAAFYELEIIARLQILWKLLLEHYTPANHCPTHDEARFERIREMMAYIEQNYMHPFSLKEIAAHVHICESECCRLFKRYMNISLFSFLQEYRIERSLEYLSSLDSVSDIAGKVGFSDSNYYSKVFSRVMGCSPREYRRNLRAD